MASDPQNFSPAVLAGATVRLQSEAVRLRRAAPDDAAALALVGGATFLEAFTWMLPGADIVAHSARHHTAEAYAAYLKHPETAIIIAETVPGGAPVGYAMLAKPELPTFAVHADDVELKRIYLFSRFRGASTPVLRVTEETGALEVVTGVRAGQALMNAAVEEACRRGKKRLLLGTHAGNLQAIAFYRKNGFVEAGTRTFQVGAQVCCDLIFSKTLDDACG